MLVLTCQRSSNIKDVFISSNTGKSVSCFSPSKSLQVQTKGKDALRQQTNFYKKKVVPSMALHLLDSRRTLTHNQLKYGGYPSFSSSNYYYTLHCLDWWRTLIYKRDVVVLALYKNDPLN